MLSDDLDALAASLRHMAQAGAELSPDMMHDMAGIADAMAGQARGLEGRPVPTEARLTVDGLAAHGNVVPLRHFAGGASA